MTGGPPLDAEFSGRVLVPHDSAGSLRSERALGVIRAYVDEERRAGTKFNTLNADAVESFINEAEMRERELQRQAGPLPALCVADLDADGRLVLNRFGYDVKRERPSHTNASPAPEP